MVYKIGIGVLILVFIILVSLVIERSFLPETTQEHVDEALLYGEVYGLPTPPNDFYFDGCTLFPDNIGSVSFLSACLQHDIAYWYGGSSEERKQADLVFRKDVRELGAVGSFLSVPMYVAVRMFGDTWILKQFGANWGFGHNE